MIKMYENMLPKEQKEGKLGYYPVTSKEEWDNLPDLYKTMEWKPVKDHRDNGKLKAVKAVLFDVTFMEPYKVRAQVSVHPQEVQKILFCYFKNADCRLYTVSGIELEGGTRLGAKWLQDTTTGAFAIYSAGEYVGKQGGFGGFIPERVHLLDDGTWKHDFKYSEGNISHYTIGNPFPETEEAVKNEIFVPTEAGDIYVSVKKDTEYPGIYVDLKGENVNDTFEKNTVSLAMIEFEPDKKKIQTVVYSNGESEEPTHIIEHSNTNKEVSLNDRIAFAKTQESTAKTPQNYQKEPGFIK